MAELNDGIISGEIRLSDLPDELILAWGYWEPPPADLTAFVLCNAEHRQEFLYQYCAQGEPALFTAVAHIWDSLAEPRELRCTLIGAACAAGGTGKMALVLMLRKLLAECLYDEEPMPRSDQFDDIDAWHQATMGYFEGDEQRMRIVCARYAGILDGTD
jgi:hypothetical protein